MKIKGVDVGKLDRLSKNRSTRGAGAKGRSGAAGGARSSQRDDVAISDDARLSSAAGEAVQNAPEIRTELVESIKEALDAGRYSVSSLEVADKILRQVLIERKKAM